MTELLDNKIKRSTKQLKLTDILKSKVQSEKNIVIEDRNGKQNIYFDISFVVRIYGH